MTEEKNEIAIVDKSPIGFLKRDDVKRKFEEVLGKRASAYLTSAISLIAQNDMLKNADPTSVYLAVMTSATLDLPINQNLGFAYILPYGNKAQFQMGYKGFVQLALRSGQFENIDAKPIYEGQLVIDDDSFLGYRFTWSKKISDKIIGYASYFKLLNGFNKIFYMTKEEIEKHGKKYSKTYKKNTGNWVDSFDEMALKTVIKLLLSKYAPLSVEMQKAIIADQGVITDENADNVEYPDNIQEAEIIVDEEELNAGLSGMKILNSDQNKNEEQNNE